MPRRRRRPRDLTGFTLPVPERAGFTLIELLVVIAIIAVLAAIITPNAFKAVEKAKISRAMQDAKTVRAAVYSYYGDVGFWPPDVGRGCDPGFTQPVPYYPDQAVACTPTATGVIPANWQAVVQATWDGPYLERWPTMTPWGGKYDWNYWPDGADRYNGVHLPPGCYVGVQGDYSNNNTIPAPSEQQLINKRFDADGTLDGEAQLLMVSL